MLYLSGVIRMNLRHPMLGFMNTPEMNNAMPAGIPWGADNARFASPEKYADARYLNWLQAQDKTTCLFATAPDVLGDHAATVQMSIPLLPTLRAIGYPPAFVAQDGFSIDDTPWALFDVLFIGGTTKFKLGAGLVACTEARRRGKRVHMGRVNSFKRLAIAADAGCSSADGTFLKYAPDLNEKRMLRWFDKLERRYAEQDLSRANA